MKKSLFFLFLIAVSAYLGFSSCDNYPNQPQNCDKAIQWDNRNPIYFSSIRLSVSENYYQIYFGGVANMVLISPSTPITDFLDVFNRTMHGGKQQSSIKITNTLNSCYYSDQSAYVTIDQTYKNTDFQQFLTHSLPASAITAGSKTYMNLGFNMFDVWRANREANLQSAVLDIHSGVYSTGNNREVRLYWTKTFDANSLNNPNVSVNATETSVSVNAGSLHIPASIIDVTPVIPFKDRLYIDGALVERNFENAISVDKETLSLKVSK